MKEGGSVGVEIETYRIELLCRGPLVESVLAIAMM